MVIVAVVDGIVQAREPILILNCLVCHFGCQLACPPITYLYALYELAQWPAPAPRGTNYVS